MARKKTGRPSAFNTKYIDEIKDFLSEGYSVAAFAGSIGVARSTVYKWADENDEFSDALKIGQARSALWWESQARKVAMTGEGNATMTIFGLKNRVSDEWRDKREVEIESSQPFAAFVLEVAQGDEESPVRVD